MGLSKESIEEFKEIYKKEYPDKELNDQEALESAYKLVGLFDALYKSAQEDAARKRRLKTEPDGFPVDGTYNCLVCHQTINQSNGWYEWWGQTCLRCRKALRDGTLPTFVCTHRESWFADWELKDFFDISYQTIRKFVRQGKLKARIVTFENGTPYEYVFLKKENPDIIKRHTPEWKSYHRHRDKVSKAAFREEKKKIKEERAKLEKKYKKQPKSITS